jgi:hypothetical protein
MSWKEKRCEARKKTGLLFTLRLLYCRIAYRLKYSVVMELTHLLYTHISYELDKREEHKGYKPLRFL